MFQVRRHQCKNIVNDSEMVDVMSIKVSRKGVMSLNSQAISSRAVMMIMKAFSSLSSCLTFASFPSIPSPVYFSCMERYIFSDPIEHKIRAITIIITVNVNT